MDKCDQCKEKDVDFVMDDGETLCAWCMAQAAKDRIIQKGIKRECPICLKKIVVDKFMFHVATVHTDEERAKLEKRDQSITPLYYGQRR